MFKPDKTYVFALGGLGEVGKNMYCLMHNDEIKQATQIAPLWKYFAENGMI